MRKNQLFKKIPDKEYVLKIMKLFGIKGFEDKRFFTRKDLDKLNTLENIKECLPELREYYLRCKADKYLDELTTKTCITVLRQLLRHYNYKIVSREKYSEGSKHLIYNLKSIEPTNSQHLVKEDVTIDFS
jgi:hypothetical protein